MGAFEAPGRVLTAILDRYRPRTDAEARDVARLRALVEGGADAWTHATPLHVTGSALVVHPPTRRVLLRWHERMERWMQVGGHVDPGETDPFATALREAAEETGLTDLVSFPGGAPPTPVQVVIVPVPPGKGEPAHEHADVRYVLATARPEEARAETAGAGVRWLGLDDALGLVEEANVLVFLERVGELL